MVVVCVASSVVVRGSEGGIHCYQCGFVELSGECRQPQTIRQKSNACLQQPEFSVCGVVLGVEDVERRAVADLTAEARGVESGSVCPEGLGQRRDPTRAHRQTQPRGTCLQGDLLPRTVGIRTGLVGEMKGLFLTRAAIPAGIERHDELYANHLAVRIDAGGAEVAAAAQAILATCATRSMVGDAATLNFADSSAANSVRAT